MLPEGMSVSEFASFDFETMPPADVYRLTTSTVVPRPIGWTVTRAANGVVNVAPYSFFNAFGENPVILVLGLLGSHEQGRRYKDTATNIVATGEFVVNLVPAHLAEAMNMTTVNAPSEVSEMELAGLTPIPSLKVAPPRIGESPVAFECKLMHALETGPTQLTVIGRVVHLHVASAFLEGDPARPRIRTPELGLIGRMHGRGWYARTTDLFEMDRPGDWKG
jgi:flavin reductase (DIM6/NTAB) family NADH-FMN oxidoreductase RutF